MTDYEFETLQYEREVLPASQFELVEAQCTTEEEVIRAAHDADALLNQYAPITRKVIERLERCQVIARYGVGVNTIDLQAATDKGIYVANVPDYCRDEVADHALALMLSWLRKIVVAHQEIRGGRWDFKATRPIYRLRGRTLGLVGFGNIPRALAEKAKPLGLQVIAYDPYCQPDAAREHGVELVSLAELCRRADVLSVHAPLTDETRGLIGREQFQLMKREALIVNTSRGPVIDEIALIDALREQQIAGAALDVVEQEPIDRQNPLLAMDNVILTPHVAWYSEEAEQEMRTKAAQSIRDVLLEQRAPVYLVNKQVRSQSQADVHEHKAK